MGLSRRILDQRTEILVDSAFTRIQNTAFKQKEKKMKVTETAVEVYALGMAEFLKQAKEVSNSTQDDYELEQIYTQLKEAAKFGLAMINQGESVEKKLPSLKKLPKSKSFRVPVLPHEEEE